MNKAILYFLLLVEIYFCYGANLNIRPRSTAVKTFIPEELVYSDRTEFGPANKDTNLYTFTVINSVDYAVKNSDLVIIGVYLAAYNRPKNFVSSIKMGRPAVSDIEAVLPIKGGASKFHYSVTLNGMSSVGLSYATMFVPSVSSLMSGCFVSDLASLHEQYVRYGTLQRRRSAFSKKRVCYPYSAEQLCLNELYEYSLVTLNLTSLQINFTMPKSKGNFIIFQQDLH